MINKDVIETLLKTNQMAKQPEKKKVQETFSILDEISRDSVKSAEKKITEKTKQAAPAVKAADPDPRKWEKQPFNFFKDRVKKVLRHWDGKDPEEGKEIEPTILTVKDTIHARQLCNLQERGDRFA